NLFSEPATVAEVQSMVDAVNSASVLAQIGLEGDDPDGINSVVTVAQLGTIVPTVTGLDANNQTAYQDYIDANPGLFSSPATQAEVQAMVTTVNAASACPTTGTVTITGAPTGAICGGSLVALSTGYTAADTYAWTASSGTFDDATSATPNLTLPTTDVNVTVNLTVTKAGCTPNSVSATAVVINVDPAPAVSITGENCLDVEQTDYDPTGDPLGDRQADPDDFTNLAYTVGTSSGATGFTWSWVSNPGNNGTINSGGSTNTADITFNKTVGAVGIYILQVEMTGFTCGDMTRSITIDVRDASCYCPTDVVDVVSTTGKTWMDRNRGAERKATSITDFLAYGCLFQWGRKNDGHAAIDWTSGTAGSSVNGTTATLSTTGDPGHAMFITSSSDWLTVPDPTLWNGAIKGINDPCPSGYRVPTEAELNNEKKTFTNSAGAFANVLKFPTPGGRISNSGNFTQVGNLGYYWTSTTTGSSARVVFWGPTGTLSSTTGRSMAYSVRCIKE
ncbi:fibrobacter succinogenes major paralogous domain-containing protein, partial [Flavobacteriaceae bacterium]|nr:fibrobacter succinogenes major paralogous domain-containing protein [Flavobacteriaceae bacterium]